MEINDLVVVFVSYLNGFIILYIVSPAMSRLLWKISRVLHFILQCASILDTSCTADRECICSTGKLICNSKYKCNKMTFAEFMLRLKNRIPVSIMFRRPFIPHFTKWNFEDFYESNNSACVFFGLVLFSVVAKQMCEGIFFRVENVFGRLYIQIVFVTFYVLSLCSAHQSSRKAARSTSTVLAARRTP